MLGSMRSDAKLVNTGLYAPAIDLHRSSVIVSSLRRLSTLSPLPGVR